MPTTVPATDPALIPSADATTAADLLLDLTLRQWRTAACEEVVEWVFDRLGYTRHLLLSTRTDMDTYTWLLQDRAGDWLVYRICVEDFPHLTFEQTIKPFSELWGNAYVDNRMDVVLAPMNATSEVMRGATANDLLLRLLSFDDLDDQDDMLAIIQWLITHQQADYAAMSVLAALGGTRGSDIDPTDGPNGTVLEYPPLVDFGCLPRP